MNYRVILLHSAATIQQAIVELLGTSTLHRYSISLIDPLKTDLTERLSTENPDFCLLDVSYIDYLPEETISAIAQRVPTILLSQQSQPAHRTSSDFIDTLSTKQLSLDVLERSFRYIIEQKNHRRQLKALALYDALTQLPNRGHFQHQLSTTIAQHARRKQAFSLVIIDLDRFKLINDSMGHECGDEYLIQTSKVIKRNLRHNDIAARLGNDEFAIILQTDQAHSMAQRLMDEFSIPFRLEDRDIRIHASVGVASFPRDGKTNSELIKAANNAMQSAKQHGGSNLCFYDARQQQGTIETSWIEAEFYNALNSNQLFLTYQPQVTADRNLCVTLEALCRWHHPDKGLIPPDIFISAIEKTPMIVDLGHWVLETACRELADLQKQGQPFKVAVNISMMHICHSHFIDDLKEILAMTGADPTLLELELTESALMIDPLQSISTLSALRELGITIAIDDFGTGHSSLAYLVDLPIDILKIDRSFIYEFTYNQKRESVVKAIIALARSLQLKTVAEGVEDQHTSEYLMLLGCDYLQGYYFSKPMMMEEILNQYAVKSQVY
jgi:diguanylate cyclase (GGDEF)-like protein